MACRRCSTCGVNYPIEIVGACGHCKGDLDYMPNAQPDEDWRDQVAMLNWNETGGRGPMYGGATAVEHFGSAVESLRGADDFLMECGDRPPPKGHDAE